MARKVNVNFPEFGISVAATLQDESEPELSELLWNSLPLRSAC